MDLAAVLTALYPDALWGESNNDYSTLVWDESNADPKPTLDELEAAWPRVEAELVNANAAAAREAAYKVEADPLFFYWQAGEGDEQAWLDKRAEIRARFPYVGV